MVKFSEEQKRIALLLLYGSKTAEELSKQLTIPYNQLMEELKQMLKLKLIAKEGYPIKYLLKPEIAKEVKRRKELASIDPFRLRLKIIIEIQAIEKELLKKQLEKMKEELRKEKEFTIYDLKTAKIIQEGEHYLSYLDVNLTVKDFRSLVKLMFFYGPTAVEVIKPAKMEFTAGDLQDGLVEWSDMVQAYTGYITRLLNREELEEFHKKLFK